MLHFFGLHFQQFLYLSVLQNGHCVKLLNSPTKAQQCALLEHTSNSINLKSSGIKSNFLLVLFVIFLIGQGRLGTISSSNPKNSFVVLSERLLLVMK